MSTSKVLLSGAFIAAFVVAILVFVVGNGLNGEDEECLTLYRSVAAAAGEEVGDVDYTQWADLGKPPLSPEEALEHFRLEDGFRIEVVAHEPMIVDPVAMDIDADGRLWVVNMPAYNSGPVREILETTGERSEEREEALRNAMPDAPRGEVVVLEDTNNDGQMDTRRVFYEGLMLPRAIKVLDDGILLGEPPNLWFIQDSDGDGYGDLRELISDEYATPRSPQSGPSALFWGMDNWMHSSNFPSLRRIDGQWHTKSFEPLGQWGMTQDDWGRFYSSSNSWPLQAHLVPHAYSDRHPSFELSSGINERIAPNEPMWPAQPTAVNRGYRVGDVTREDGTLRIGAGISSTVIYRGDQFGEAYRGDAFSPVGGGNLIKRIQLQGDLSEIETEGQFAYEEQEFLTSTDERFRPVNIYNAPDGSLYVLDLYRGLYDYVLWVTEYLADYTLEHGLEEPTGELGRIYRIVRDDQPVDYEVPRFSELSASDIAEYLRNENGHFRDQAQQVLAMCSPSEVIDALESMTADAQAEAYTRLQSLWTLEGFSRSVYSQDDLTSAALQSLEDEHPRVRAAAIRVLEPALADGDEATLARLESLADEESSPYVQLQLLASLGESDSDDALRLMALVLNDNADNSYFREMALTGVHHREDRFAEILEQEHGWDADQVEAGEFLAQLSEASEELQERDLGHLTEAQLALYERGERMYTTCSACHGAEGQGMSGIGSPLAGSEWVQGSSESLVRIVLHGVDGAAAERGEHIPNDMPGHGFLSDEDVAAILTFMRQSWGNDAPPIEPDEVEEIRQESEGRTELWSPEELRALEEGSE